MPLCLGHRGNFVPQGDVQPAERELGLRANWGFIALGSCASWGLYALGSRASWGLYAPCLGP